MDRGIWDEGRRAAFDHLSRLAENEIAETVEAASAIPAPGVPDAVKMLGCETRQ